MTESERAALHSWRNRQALCAAGFALALAVFALFAARIVSTGVSAFSTFEPLLALASLAWTILFCRTPARWLAAGRDLRSDAVREVAGRARLRARRGVGLYAPVRTRLIVGSRRFEITERQADAVIEGAAMRARYGEKSGALLSVAETSPDAAWPIAGNAPLEPLNEREKDILRLIAGGYSDKEIARKLALSPATVRTYNTAIYAKLGVARRTQAAPYAAALGLGEPGSGD